MRHLQKTLVALFLLLFWGFVWKYGEENFGSDVRFFVDIWDLRTYYNNGKWFPMGAQPYVDVPSEYPQVATYLFGWVHRFGADQPRAGVAREVYFRAFRMIMLLTAYAVFLLLEYMRESRKWIPLLLFLPGPLYYIFNRFDILPAFFCLLALWFVKRRNWLGAAILLAVAAMTKWYALLLMPSLLAYAWQADGKIPWKPALAFALTVAGIALPTFLAGGLDALLLPYTFHFNRASEPASLAGVLISALGPFSEKPVANIFLVLQILPSALSFFFSVRSFERLTAWWFLVVGGFVFFSRIYSPQWILWVLPMLLLLVEETFDIGLIVLYGVLAYIGFPLAYDGMPSALLGVHLAALGCLFLLMLRFARRLHWQFAIPFVRLKPQVSP